MLLLLPTQSFFSISWLLGHSSAPLALQGRCWSRRPSWHPLRLRFAGPWYHGKGRFGAKTSAVEICIASCRWTVMRFPFSRITRSQLCRLMPNHWPLLQEYCKRINTLVYTEKLTARNGCMKNEQCNAYILQLWSRTLKSCGSATAAVVQMTHLDRTLSHQQRICPRSLHLCRVTAHVVNNGSATG